MARKLLPPTGLTLPGLRGLLGVQGRGGCLVDLVGGVSVEYALTSIIGQQLFLQGCFEDQESDFLCQRLGQWREPVFLDIGANIGLHSLRAARARPDARVLAFEPAHETLALLGRNIARNGLAGRIEVWPVAVGQCTGRAHFHYCLDDAYSSLVPDGRRPVKDTYEVEVVCLDDWLPAAGIGHVHLLKLDVEGGEAEAIAGARRTLSAMRPELVVEIFQGDRRPGFADDLIRQIRSFGYEAFVLRDGKPVPFGRHSDEQFNYFFKPCHA